MAGGPGSPCRGAPQGRGRTSTGPSVTQRREALWWQQKIWVLLNQNKRKHITGVLAFQTLRLAGPMSPPAPWLRGGEPLVVWQWPGPLERGRSHRVGGMSHGSRKECCKDKGVSRGTGHQRSAGLGIYKGWWAKLRPVAGGPGLVSTGPLFGSQGPPSSSDVCQLRACDLCPHRASATLHPARLSFCPSVSNPCLPISSCPAWPASPHVSLHLRHHNLSLAVAGIGRHPESLL